MNIGRAHEPILTPDLLHRELRSSPGKIHSAEVLKKDGVVQTWTKRQHLVTEMTEHLQDEGDPLSFPLRTFRISFTKLLYDPIVYASLACSLD